MPGRVLFLTWHGSLIHPEMHEFVSGWLRMVTYLTLCDRTVVATGPLPAMGRGTRHPVNNVKVLLLVLTPSGTCSFSELGHVNKYS